MNCVLASSAGNAVEVREAVQFLTGEYRNPRLFDVSREARVEMPDLRPVGERRRRSACQTAGGAG